ncbi:MAG: hypothetical protein K0U62_11485 [Actinomycetia bacterium]|nr:hypothetical protein [Actinomycetes bacterium]
MATRRKKKLSKSLQRRAGISVADEAYEALHWGTPPIQTEDILILDQQKAVPVAECVACSYVTVKDGVPAIWRHDFKRIGGRGPFLLEVPERASKDATHRTVKVANPSDMIALGRLIDLELLDLDGNPMTVYTPFMWVCTTTECLKPAGGPVLLGSRFEVPYGIEHRRGAPYINERGIVD